MVIIALGEDVQPLTPGSTVLPYKDSHHETSEYDSCLHKPLVAELEAADPVAAALPDPLPEPELIRERKWPQPHHKANRWNATGYIQAGGGTSPS